MLFPDSNTGVVAVTRAASNVPAPIVAPTRRYCVLDIPRRLNPATERGASGTWWKYRELRKPSSPQT